MKMNGFTLVELLITLSIVITMSSLLFVGFRSGDKSLALERSAHQVAQSIRKATDLSFRAEASTICDSGGGALSGYGIYFDENDSDQYIFYANCNGSDKEGYKAVGGNRDVAVETISLDRAVEIDSVSTGSNWSIAFFPPDPRTAICANDSCNAANQLTSSSVILRVKGDPARTRIITINEKGVIDID